MISINARNVHDALAEGVNLINEHGVLVPSRNGDALRVHSPVTTVYEHPEERVLFWGGRDANPFFHLFESIWMLAGRNDVEFVSTFVKRMSDFSDDGKTFNGAYGHRWRSWFGRDQLLLAIHELRSNPESRRVVVQMWDGGHDLGLDSKDLPCNTAVYFQKGTDGSLEMMVTNRSNDMILGAYGANAVHMSFLHEFVARSVGLNVGRYYQTSFNFHAYVEDFERLAEKESWIDFKNPYEDAVEPVALFQTPEESNLFLRDCKRFCAFAHSGSEDLVEAEVESDWFKNVAVPMLRVWKAWRTKNAPERFTEALKLTNEIQASDWRKAAVEWIARRYERWDGGQP
ncbi:MAG: hypothetical protein CMJ75_18805 [Planctomycetaceae bacterium]|nr:hypothetical protein [Planctomycetaceae bacterium]